MGRTGGEWATSAFDITTVIAIKDGPDDSGREYQDGRHQVTIFRPDPGQITDVYERAANAKLGAAAGAAATAVEALGYDGQEAVEKLPQMVEALDECLGALTGGLDGKWSEGADPAGMARAALPKRLEDK